MSLEFRFAWQKGGSSKGSAPLVPVILGIDEDSKWGEWECVLPNGAKDRDEIEVVRNVIWRVRRQSDDGFGYVCRTSPVEPTGGDLLAALDEAAMARMRHHVRIMNDVVELEHRLSLM